MMDAKRGTMASQNVKSGWFGSPTLGGWLTIGNCAYWALLYLAARLEEFNGMPGIVGMGIFVSAVCFSVPLALVCWIVLSILEPPHVVAVLTLAVAVGSNAILWGYGLAWLIEKILGRRRADDRGFSVIVIPDENSSPM